MADPEIAEDGGVSQSVKKTMGVSSNIFFKCGRYLGYATKKVNGATHLVADEIVDMPGRVSGSLKRLFGKKSVAGGRTQKIKKVKREKTKVSSKEAEVKDLKEKVDNLNFEGLLEGARFESASVRVKFVQAVKGLASSDPKVRMTSSHELGNYGGEYATAILEKALRLEKNSRVKGEVLRSLSKSAGEDVIPIFVEILSDTGEATHIRTAAMEGLYEIRKEGCIEELKRYLKDPDPVVRRRSVSYLAWLGDRSSAPTIISLLNDRDNHTRKEAVNALGVLRLKSTVMPLIESLLDNDKDVRARAQRVLSSLVGVHPIGRLDASIDERIMAVRELKEWWKKRQSSLPEILSVSPVGKSYRKTYPMGKSEKGIKRRISNIEYRM